MFNKIDKLTQTEFTEVFGNIFENASWIAKILYEQKPFKNFNELSKKMVHIFEATNIKEKLKILNAHPDLANKIKISLLTPDSLKEQASARLDQCTEEEFDEFKHLNKQYKKKFGFPFILAVKGKNKNEILDNFKKKISFDPTTEFDQAIKQVKQIASLRLKELDNKGL